MCAALNTVEPPIVEREAAWYMERNEAWHEHHLPIMEERIRTRLGPLSAWLGDADWLSGAFSAGDLMMVSVLLRLKASSDMLQAYPHLPPYVARAPPPPPPQPPFHPTPA